MADPLKTFIRIISLGGNAQVGDGRSIVSSAYCSNLVTGIAIETRLDAQRIRGVVYGLGASCGGSSTFKGINYVGKARSDASASSSPMSSNTTFVQQAGPTAKDGIRDLVVGTALAVNATAPVASRERFVVVFIGYAGTELRADSAAAMVNGTAVGGGNGTATVSLRGQTTWKQAESDAAGCALIGLEGAEMASNDFINGMRLLFACPAVPIGTTASGTNGPRSFAIASVTSGTPTPTPSSSTETSTFGDSVWWVYVLGAGVAALSLGVMALVRSTHFRNKKMFEPRL